MNNLTYLLLVLFSYFGNAQSKQENSSDFVVTYQIDSKSFGTSDTATKEEAKLIVNESGRVVFMLQSMILLDSVQQIRELNASDIVRYRATTRTLIKRDNSSIIHFEDLGGEVLKFEEEVVFNWHLLEEEKMISGYLCKKAEVLFAGRKWIAWYAMEIPVNAGPYKFYGLPGLILDVKDSNNLYHFTAMNLKNQNFTLNPKIGSYFITEGIKKIDLIDKKEFYESRKKFYQMSLQERFQYMSRKEAVTTTIAVTSPITGENIRKNQNLKVRNFIEVYD